MSKYRKNWETRPFLKDWIQEVPNDNTKAYCRACKINLYAHRYSVLKHTSTKKHQNNYEKMLQGNILQNHVTDHNHHEEMLPHLVKVCAKQTEVSQECLLEEAIIDGDAIIYNESLDVFISTSNDVMHTDATSPENVNHYETVALEEKTILCENVAFEEVSGIGITTAVDDVENMSNSPADEPRTISSHILDTSLGKAAANVDITIYRLVNNNWKQLNQAKTNEDGRCSQLVSSDNFETGTYKLSFNVRPYYAANMVKSFYPYIDIVVECTRGEHYHIPLLLSPFGYSTYKGT